MSEKLKAGVGADDRNESEGEQVRESQVFNSQDVMISAIPQDSSRKVCSRVEGKYSRQKSFTSPIPMRIIAAGRDQILRYCDQKGY